LRNNLIVVFIAQEYCSCNHKFLYDEFAINNFFSNVLIIEIPADVVYSPFFKPKRIINHFMGFRKLSRNTYIYRPMILVRELIANHYLNKINGRFLRRSLSELQIIKNADNIFCLFYNPRMYEIAKESFNNPYMLYYVTDEYKYIASNCKINKLLYKYERVIMPNCDLIFTASDKLTERRKKYNKNVFTIGNGTSLKNITQSVGTLKNISWSKHNSIGMFGHIRDWIDFNLLEQLIREMPNMTFVYAGAIQKKIESYFLNFVSNNNNCMYLGIIPKEKMNELYKSVSVGIVPYKQNKFIEASKPIKIADFIINGIPVVSVPNSGYKEYYFLKFAKTINEFKELIIKLIGTKIDQNSFEYADFIDYNTWNRISNKMVDKIKTLSGVRVL